jgi:hypothetical protein
MSQTMHQFRHERNSHRHARQLVVSTAQKAVSYLSKSLVQFTDHDVADDLMKLGLRVHQDQSSQIRK